MKSAVFHIRIFVLTFFAHSESCHSGIGTVVWQSFDDGKTRAAVGAIGKGIVQTVPLPFHILKAVVTNGNIGTYLGDFVNNDIIFAPNNPKIRK
jgi:hypothetical protein